MRTDILDRENEIRQWVQECKSKAYICKQLKCRPLTLDSYLQKMEIRYKGNKSGKGTCKIQEYTDAYEYSKRDYCSASRLREKLIQEGIKERKCEMCGITHIFG